MNLILISTEKYPDQHAAAIRHSTLAKGMVELGHTVYFMLLSPQDWPKAEMDYHGVNFKTLNRHHETDRLLRIYNFYRGIKKLREKITEINLSSGVDAIIVFAIKIRIIQSVLELGKKENIPVFHERTELPYVFHRKYSIQDVIHFQFYMRRLVPRFDGIFVISEKLMDFFMRYNPSTVKILTVVDTDFFDVRNDYELNFPYIAYCGNMDSKKDGLDILIQAFALLNEKFPHMKLLLIGNDSNTYSKENLIHIISTLKLNDKIEFTGQVEREEMPRLLGNAKLLVVAKPDNEQNSGNFPIKVGEYLATGVPVVLTTVGEIPNFVTDGETGFLAAPGSVESFYNKMVEALSDYERAQKIGAKGRELAKQVFDYKRQASLMLSFIESTITAYNHEDDH
jgi:glycosyltransferase involved in cell wall biosynthesis